MKKWNALNNKDKKGKTGVGVSIQYAYTKVRDWMMPTKDQPIYLQIILFIIKLPVLLAILALSPIFLILMIIAFVVAL